MMSRLRWAVITGEYPPQPGGVSDYTRLVACGLARAGDEVHVWAPVSASAAPADPGVTVHHLPGHFGPRALARLDRALNGLPRPYRVLVQYVPQAFGCKGMNVPFCLWLCSRRRDPVWVMFHEVAFPLGRRQPLAHNLLGVVNRLMAVLLVRAADRIFVSIPGWASLLPGHASGPRRVDWLPVPSNIPTAVAPEAVADVRRRITASRNDVLVGHFGTFGGHVTALLAGVLPSLLYADARRVGLLVGRGGEQFAGELIRAHPVLDGRLRATGVVAAEQVAAYLAACDCLVQPYADGVSTRRTSLMAGLALGLPIITTAGPLTEPLWQESGAVVLARSCCPAAVVAAVEVLLSDAGRRTQLRQQAAALYETRFSLSQTIQSLRTSATGRHRAAA
ncbi:MAG TPA: glycosyltransferase family 4 protein [Gemmataceae bacterium]|nr:glycosyltransferase family 4 protein [Gemmataceae bacterium]